MNTTQGTAGLLPCPFCAGTDLESCHDDGAHWIKCKGCGATGPLTTRYSGEEGEEYASWNYNTRELSAKPAPVEAPDWTEGLMPMPLNPSIGMIEDGAQRLVSWEDGCKWPDSWSALQVSAARNEAERVWRSMWLNWKENSPLPALTVADEPVADAAKFEQLLGELRAAEYNAGESRRDPGKSGEAEAEALRAYFKASRSPVQEGAQGVELQLPADGAYVIRYDDTDKADEMFAMTGARDGAFKRYRQISSSWNAHLYVKIDSNCRDVKCPSASFVAPSQAIPEGRIVEAAKTALEALQRVQPQTRGVLVVQDVEYAISKLQSALSTPGTGGSNG